MKQEKGNNLKWYPVYTNPRSEKKSFELLKMKGIEAYLPLQRQLKQWSDRRKWVEEPVLRSYLFVKISEREQADVLSTRGISRFIYFSGKIASIPEQQIETLKLLLASEADFELVDRDFEKGELVEITAGILKGLQGELLDIYSQKRLLIRIDHTGQSILVQVPAVFLDKASYRVD
ncbi:UpxY family transcription antiterminator [Desertivirga xinjiangensis]|uniref:UpxY family transcription antiterminator n=1 Tax=Desertivirga xinjiangensis TaxID=539206 RepID=UPI00210BCB64|nr:UpxY family transcription antiterminator [Pedobacter xinjiangensis]